MKVFIGLTEIAGYYSNLAKGFNRIGIDCNYVNLDNHPFGYENKFEPFIAVLVRSIKKKRKDSTANNWVINTLWRVLYYIFYRLLFVWAILFHKVFIFGFASSFFNYKELRLLKKLNKTVIYFFHGSDARPPYLRGGIYLTLDKSEISKINSKSILIKNRIKKIERYADYCIAQPEIGQFFEQPFINFYSIGLPFDNESKGKSVKSLNDSVRILHSPSNPLKKGTAEIEKHIKNLQEKGYSINFIKIAGKSNKEVLKEIQHCDFVVDQLYSDTPMAGFSTEAAFYGKPAVVGGYANFNGNEFTPPSEYCHPDQIEKAIEKLINNKTYRDRLGKNAQEFIMKNWSPEAVAERYYKLILNKVNEKWKVLPGSIDYIFGSASSKSNRKKILSNVVEQSGEESLLIEDKPQLKAKIIEFIKSSK